MNPDKFDLNYNLEPKTVKQNLQENWYKLRILNDFYTLFWVRINRNW